MTSSRVESRGSCPDESANANSRARDVDLKRGLKFRLGIGGRVAAHVMHHLLRVLPWPTGHGFGRRQIAS